MHLFEIAVAVEGRVAAEQEVGDYAYGPDVAIVKGAKVRFWCPCSQGKGWSILTLVCRDPSS